MYGCGALGHFSGIDENRAHIADAGGIEAIVAALYAHPSSAPVQRNGSYALRNLARNDANRALMAEAGVIEAVLAALEAHPANPDVQRNGCAVLGNLYFGGPELECMDEQMVGS